MKELTMFAEAGKFSVLVAAALACGGLSADTYFAKSPDGRNEIRLNTDGAFAYSVLRDGVVLVKDAPLALVTEGHGALGIHRGQALLCPIEQSNN